ncbi:MAG TPA: T9SS type A sorting domain-containing protein, partial [bacterium]|nr:T9SS type A sorting domain-containing protein [bacterium]
NGPVQLVVAAPNVSRNGEPIKFTVNLPQPMQVHLALFDLVGEKVFDASLQGNSGLNNFSWDLENLSKETVASGLYIYLLEANNGMSTLSQRGKIAVLR